MKKIITKSILTLAILLPHMAKADLPEETKTFLKGLYPKKSNYGSELIYPEQGWVKFGAMVSEINNEWRSVSARYHVAIPKKTFFDHSFSLHDYLKTRKVTQSDICVDVVISDCNVKVVLEARLEIDPVISWLASYGENAEIVAKSFDGWRPNHAYACERFKNWLAAEGDKAIEFLKKAYQYSIGKRISSVESYVYLYNWYNSCGDNRDELLKIAGYFPNIDWQVMLDYIKRWGVAEEETFRFVGASLDAYTGPRLIVELLKAVKQLPAEDRAKLTKSKRIIFYEDISGDSAEVTAQTILKKFLELTDSQLELLHYAQEFCRKGRFSWLGEKSYEFDVAYPVCKATSDDDAQLACLLLFRNPRIARRHWDKYFVGDVRRFSDFMSYVREKNNETKRLAMLVAPLVAGENLFELVEKLAPILDQELLADPVIKAARRIVELTGRPLDIYSDPQKLLKFLREVKDMGDCRDEIITLVHQSMCTDCVHVFIWCAGIIKDLGTDRLKILDKAKEIYEGKSTDIRWEEARACGKVGFVQDAQRYFESEALEVSIPDAKELLKQVETVMKTQLYCAEKIALLKAKDSLLQASVIQRGGEVVRHLDKKSTDTVRLFRLIEASGDEWPEIFELAKQNQSKESSFDDFVDLLVLIADIEANRAKMLEKAKEFFTADYPQQNWEQVDLAYKEHAVGQARDFFEQIALEASLPTANENLEQVDEELAAKKNMDDDN